MKGLRVMMLAAALCLAAGCAPGEEQTQFETVDLSIDANEYVVFNKNVSGYQGGALLVNGRMWCFDAVTAQLVPLCMRSECTHKFDPGSDTNECPSAYIGPLANLFGVYGEHIWFLAIGGETGWELWRADVTGENVVKQCSLAIDETASTLWSGAIYEGRFFVTEVTFEEAADGEDQSYSRVIAIRLKDGQVQPVTAQDTAIQNVVGVHGDWVYYQSGERVDDVYRETLYRAPISGGTPEAVAEGPRLDAFLNDGWLAYIAQENGGAAVYLHNLDTDAVEILARSEKNDLHYPVIANGKLVWAVWMEETRENQFAIYSLADGSSEMTPPYDTDTMGIIWGTGEGWLFGGAGKYAYIEETAFLNGEALRELN